VACELLPGLLPDLLEPTELFLRLPQVQLECLAQLG
jgi:hypothetical protein